jgi:hypothetical protein
MQTHKYQQFRNDLQNPLVTLPILMFLLSAAHSWFNQVKSLLGVNFILLGLTQFSRVCPPMEAQDQYVFKSAGEIRYVDSSELFQKVSNGEKIFVEGVKGSIPEISITFRDNKDMFITLTLE